MEKEKIFSKYINRPVFADNISEVDHFVVNAIGYKRESFVKRFKEELIAISVALLVIGIVFGMTWIVFFTDMF